MEQINRLSFAPSEPSHRAPVEVHMEPVWRSRANFLVCARFEREDGAWGWEQLWVRRNSVCEFEVCCIPFFARNIDLGDRVLTRAFGDQPYVVNRVLSKSGRVTFRATLAPSSAEAREDVVDHLLRCGCLIEWHSEDLLGIDAGSEPVARSVEAFLLDQEMNGRLSFEAGRTA